MELRKLSPDEVARIRAAATERAKWPLQDRVHLGRPEEASTLVLGACAWACVVVVQDRPVLVGFVALAVALQLWGLLGRIAG